ncbi:MAG: alpha/beta fold hydrolase [Gammaproteobacteria bacterium]|nr:alpha/beta fold hydrolase [Gammaproteobacteria bacterium]
MKTLLLVALLIYGAAAGYLYLFQRSYIYFPALTRPAALDTNLELVRDGVTLRGWRLQPGHDEAFVYFGGNAERIEYNIPEFEALLPRHTIYMLAYRGYGDSGGSPTEEALVRDALALYDRVAGDHERVAVMGRSLGSAVAVAVAARRPVARLALITPFDSLVTVGAGAFPLFPVGLLLKDRYAAVKEAPAVTADTLILHAARDEIIPAAGVRRLVDAFPAERLEVVEIPGTGHNDIAAQPAYYAALAAFLN